MDLDEKMQVLTSNMYIKMSWTDYSMRWDADEYNGIEKLRYMRRHKKYN